MNKITTLSLTLIATFIISACGSGGGSGKDGNRTAENPQHINQANALKHPTPKTETPKTEALKADVPKVETPKAEAPKVEVPKTEAPKVDVPKVETPKVEAPKVDVPKVETPKVEAPKVDVPKVEAPKTEVPKADIPKVEAPKAEAPKVDVPKVEAPKAEIPKADAPKVEAPKAEVPKVDVPKVETPKTEVPKVDIPKVETPKTEVPKVDAPKVEMPKTEVPKVDVPKVEAPKIEAPKAEIPKVEEPKAEEPKAEEPKMDAPTYAELGVTGAFYTANDGKYTRKVLENAENPQVIVIDGNAMQIAKSSETSEPRDWAYSPEKFVSCCSQFESVRFGHIGDYQPDTSWFFYNGQPTKSMPTAGVVDYRGQFIAEGSVKNENAPPTIFGTVDLQADFGAKTLTGKLVEQRLSPIQVEAKIEENRFKGSAVSDVFHQPAEVEGKFYGENAKELGGIFTDKKHIIGAFGASQP